MCVLPSLSDSLGVCEHSAIFRPNKQSSRAESKNKAAGICAYWLVDAHARERPKSKLKPIMHIRSCMPCNVTSHNDVQSNILNSDMNITSNSVAAPAARVHMHHPLVGVQSIMHE
jgi:hypothetical protein